MKLIWDKIGEKFFENGVNKGVLYPQVIDGTYPKGVAWNGLTAVTESPSGAEASPLYADNIKYLNLMSVEEFSATIEAYTYPDEFAECNGEVTLTSGVFIGQQEYKIFGMSYQTKVGNDIDSDLGYKIHLIYGALSTPTEKAYATINDNPEAITFSWEITTTPVEITEFKPIASLVIDSTKVNPRKLTIIENILYGSDNAEARLPLPDEILSIINDTETEKEVVEEAIENMSISIKNDELIFDYDENVLNINFNIKDNDLIVNDNDDYVDFEINENKELEVLY